MNIVGCSKKEITNLPICIYDLFCIISYIAIRRRTFRNFQVREIDYRFKISTAIECIIFNARY